MDINIIKRYTNDRCQRFFMIGYVTKVLQKKQKSDNDDSRNDKQQLDPILPHITCSDRG